MEVIFATTNKRKVEDLENLIRMMNLNIRVLSLDEICFTEKIEENGKTLEDNSLIKARTVYDFCLAKGINLPIISDDAGLFVDYLNGRPGIYTDRYADQERAQNPSLPKHQCVVKLLEELDGVTKEKRTATYHCVVTCMLPDGTYFQESGESSGYIANKISSELKRPYFYTVFVLNELDKVFGKLEKEELENTYRYNALRMTLKKLSNYVK